MSITFLYSTQSSFTNAFEYITRSGFSGRRFERELMKQSGWDVTHVFHTLLATPTFKMRHCTLICLRNYQPLARYALKNMEFFVHAAVSNFTVLVLCGGKV